MNNKSTDQNSSQQEDFLFIEALYNEDCETVSIIGNKAGLNYLAELLNDLANNGMDGSHYHLEEYSGLDGNVKLILGKSNAPTVIDSKNELKTNRDKNQIRELPKDIPQKVLELVNSGRPLEAIKLYLNEKKIGIIEARNVVSELSRIREAGLRISRLEE